MWRQNAFPGNRDSDQSISDEEDFDSKWPQNRLSSAGPSEKKEELQLSSRLQILKVIILELKTHLYISGVGTNKLKCGRQKRINSSLKDEVKLPVSHKAVDFIGFPRKARTFNSDEEIISDNEEDMLASFSIVSEANSFQRANFHSFENDERDEADTWSAVSKETEALVHLSEKASCSSSHLAYSRTNKFGKGVRGGANPSFSFHFKSHRGEFSLPDIPKDEKHFSNNGQEILEAPEANEYRITEHSMADIFEDFLAEKKKKSDFNKVIFEVETHGHVHAEHSMAELLDGLQEKIGSLRAYPEYRTKGKRAQLAVRKNKSTLGYRTIDNLDSPEPMGSGSSTDDETSEQNLKLAIPEIQRQTMADRFQEALGSASLNDEGVFSAAPRSSGTGLFGKLQQVMLIEKNRDADFLKNMQKGADPNNDASGIDVEILSRYLDAKLTVCHCTFGKTKESAQWPGTHQARRIIEGSKGTIIFNAKVCGDVELEVGHLIRIHPPWKEIKTAGSDESIILSTYFSQISM